MIHAKQVLFHRETALTPDNYLPVLNLMQELTLHLDVMSNIFTDILKLLDQRVG